MASTIDLSQIEGLATAGLVWTEPHGPVCSDVRLYLSAAGAVTLERDVYAAVLPVSADEHYGRALSWPVADSAGDGYGYRVDVGALAAAIPSDSRLRDALAGIGGPGIHHAAMATVHERLEALTAAHVEFTE